MTTKEIGGKSLDQNCYYEGMGSKTVRFTLNGILYE